jgi:hypothetical protein
MPLERATYHGICDIVQLPLVLVCDVTVCDEELVPELEADDDVVPLPDVVADVPLELVPLDDVPLELVPLDEVADAVCAAVEANPSCHARTPPSESIDATLSAVTALRARAARGLRRGRGVPARRTGVSVGVGSSMAENLRTCGERAPRAG